METSERQDEGALTDDLIWGVAGIAKFVGITERQAQHQIDSGQMPVKYQGRRIVASKTVLRAHFTTPSPRQPAASRHHQPVSATSTAPAPRGPGRPRKQPAVVASPPTQPVEQQ